MSARAASLSDYALLHLSWVVRLHERMNSSKSAISKLSAAVLIMIALMFAVATVEAIPPCWCCKDGKINKTTQANCKKIGGQCYPSKNQAEKNCISYKDVTIPRR